MSQFELRSILGLSDDSQLITLQENIELGNTKDVLVEIDKIRHHLSEDEIRFSLIEWSEKKLRTTELYQISLWIEFLTGLLEKPTEKNWTDILVVKASEFFRTLTDNDLLVEKKSSTKSDDILIQFINELSDNHPEISLKVNIDDLLYRDNKIIFSNNLSGSLNSEEINVLRNIAGIQGLPLVISQ